MAFATPAFVRSFTGTNTSSSTNVVLTVPAAGVPAGSTVIIGYNVNGAGTLNSITDSVGGNTWRIDRNSTSTTGGAFTSGYINNALPSGATITTVGASALSGRLAIAAVFTGLDPVAPFDKEDTTATGTSTAPLSVATAATSQTHEVVCGWIGLTSTTTTLWTGIAAGYTEIARLAGNSTRELLMAYKIVTATGTQQFSGTLSASTAWRCMVTTYKAEDVVASALPIIVQPPRR